MAKMASKNSSKKVVLFLMGWLRSLWAFALGPSWDLLGL